LVRQWQTQNFNTGYYFKFEPGEQIVTNWYRNIIVVADNYTTDVSYKKLSANRWRVSSAQTVTTVNFQGSFSTGREPYGTAVVAAATGSINLSVG